MSVKVSAIFRLTPVDTRYEGFLGVNRAYAETRNHRNCRGF